MNIEDLAARQRLQSAAKAKRIAQRRTDVAFWDGSAATLGDEKSLPTTVSSNGPLRSGQSVRLLQSAGINQADTFSRTEPAENAPVRLRKDGTVKVCLSVSRPNGDIEYWIGGDRKTPILAYTVAVAENANVSLARFESTGDTPEKWILAFKLSKKNSQDSRLLILNGSSEIIDSGYAPKWRDYSYYGNGFWSITPIIPSLSFTNTPYQSSVGDFAGVITRHIAGQVHYSFGEAAWDFRFSDLERLGATNRTVTNGSTISNFSVSPQVSGIDLAPNASYSDQSIANDRWTQVPFSTRFDALASVSNNPGDFGLPCAPAVTATSQEGFREGNTDSVLSAQFSARTYSGTFGISIVDSFNPYTIQLAQEFHSYGKDWDGWNTTATNYCIENRLGVDGNQVFTTGQSEGTSSSSSSQVLEWQSSVFVAPGTAKNISYKANYSIQNGNFTNRALEVTGSYLPLKVFNNGQSYFYNSTAIDAFGIPIYDKELASSNSYAYPNALTSENASFINFSGTEQRITSYPFAVNIFSWIVKDGSLTLFEWQYYSEKFPNGGLIGQGPLTDLLTKDQSLKNISRYTLENGMIAKKDTATGYVNAMKGIGATVQNSSVVGSYYWPKG